MIFQSNCGDGFSHDGGCRPRELVTEGCCGGEQLTRASLEAVQACGRRIFGRLRETFALLSLFP